MAFIWNKVVTSLASSPHCQCYFTSFVDCASTHTHTHTHIYIYIYTADKKNNRLDNINLYVCASVCLII